MTTFPSGSEAIPPPSSWYKSLKIRDQLHPPFNSFPDNTNQVRLKKWCMEKVTVEALYSLDFSQIQPLVTCQGYRQPHIKWTRQAAITKPKATLGWAKPRLLFFTWLLSHEAAYRPNSIRRVFRFVMLGQSQNTYPLQKYVYNLNPWAR